MDAAALQRLRALYGGGRACLVYVPAHKSHLDYLLLRWEGWDLMPCQLCCCAGLCRPQQARRLPGLLRAQPCTQSIPLSARSYILFGCGLPCPHIAAGANLRLPLVGRLLRACGAL